MKTLLIILIGFFSFSVAPDDISDDIAAALKQGNAVELSKYFTDKLSIKIINQEDFISKSQAQAVVEEFFSKNKVKNFQTSHASTINGNQQYITGNLDTSVGKYRVSILIRGNLISQLRIENDNE